MHVQSKGRAIPNKSSDTQKANMFMLCISLWPLHTFPIFKQWLLDLKLIWILNLNLNSQTRAKVIKCEDTIIYKKHKAVWVFACKVLVKRTDLGSRLWLDNELVHVHLQLDSAKHFSLCRMQTTSIFNLPVLYLNCWTKYDWRALALSTLKFKDLSYPSVIKLGLPSALLITDDILMI